MITAVKTKTDSDLLEIWVHQNDYVPEMVTSVKAEIERRNLDTSGLHVITREETEKKKEAVQTKSDQRWARVTALLNGALALSIALNGLRRADPLVVSAVLLVLVSLLMVVSAGIWMRKRWALIAGLIFYAIVAVTVFAEIIGNVISRRSLQHLDPNDFAVLLICVLMTATFNRLRKGAGTKRAQGS